MPLVTDFLVQREQKLDIDCDDDHTEKVAVMSCDPTSKNDRGCVNAATDEREADDETRIG